MTIDRSLSKAEAEMKFMILDENHKLIPADLLTWAKWNQQSGCRRVAFDKINNFEISTVFLGIDHSFGGTPQWFETMIFPENTRSDEYCERYETWDQAVEGHKKACELVKSGEIK